MATKEDILEQIVEEYLLHKGYFVRHNVKFMPSKSHAEYNSKKDCVASDIDVIGVHPLIEGPDKIWVVSCKSWQGGFRPKSLLASIREKKQISGRDAWKGFHELTSDKWAEGFLGAINLATGSNEFTYVVAATHVIGDQREWEHEMDFKRRLKGNPIRIVRLKEMIAEILSRLTRTPAATEVGRMLQLFKSAKIL